jgi:hypothetical protein
MAMGGREIVLAAAWLGGDIVGALERDLALAEARGGDDVERDDECLSFFFSVRRESTAKSGGGAIPLHLGVGGSPPPPPPRPTPRAAPEDEDILRVFQERERERERESEKRNGGWWFATVFIRLKGYRSQGRWIRSFEIPPPFGRSNLFERGEEKKFV